MSADWLRVAARPPFGRGDAAALPHPDRANEFLVLVLPLAPRQRVRQRLAEIRVGGCWLRVVGLGDSWRPEWGHRLASYSVVFVFEGDAHSRSVIARARRDVPDAPAFVLPAGVTVASIYCGHGADGIRARLGDAYLDERRFVAGVPVVVAAWERELLGEAA